MPKTSRYSTAQQPTSQRPMTSFGGMDLLKKSGLSPVKQLTMQTSMSGSKGQNIKPYSSQVKAVPSS